MRKNRKGVKGRGVKMFIQEWIEIKICKKNAVSVIQYIQFPSLIPCAVVHHLAALLLVIFH